MTICAYAHILQVYSYIVNTRLNMEGWSGQLYNKQTGETRFNGKVSEINNTLVWYRKGSIHVIGVKISFWSRLI